MKKISLLLAMALASVVLTACSAGPKSDPVSASNLAPVVAENKIPVVPPVVQPTTDPELVKAPVKPKVTPAPLPALVTIQNFAFAPASLTVKKGQTVKWTNKDSVGHTITSDSFQSKILKQNESFSFTFAKLGTFTYHCSPHPNMTGSVVVK